MLSLYRMILKLHAVQLQPLQRTLGDKFVRAEFRSHLRVNEKYAQLFYQSWYSYCAQIERGVTQRDLSREEEEMLSMAQREKLTRLRIEAENMKHANKNRP